MTRGGFGLFALTLFAVVSAFAAGAEEDADVSRPGGSSVLIDRVEVRPAVRP